MGFFVTKLIIYFFVAFGIVLGATLFSGLGAFFAQQSPLYYMSSSFMDNIKIWAVVAAIGGTMDPIRVIMEGHFLEGQLSPVAKQILWILSAFTGAHSATVLIKWLLNGETYG